MSFRGQSRNLVMKEFDLNNLVRENVKNLKPYSSARDEFKEFDADMVFLDANENPFENGVNRYPDPQQRNLKSILAERKGVEETKILLGNGSDEVLDLIFRAFCEPHHDNIITLPPTYGMYKVLAETNAVENKEVLLTRHFEPDVSGVFKVTNANTKLLFICSPNNPTANLFNTNVVQSVLENFSGLVVIDEAYIDFADNASMLHELKNYQNLMISQTFSKAFGMAGIRVGVGIAHEEIINILNRIKPPYNVNGVSQEMGLNRLGRIEEVASEITQLKLERSRLINFLEHQDAVIQVYPTDANFVLFQVSDANKYYDRLVENGVIVRNRTSAYGCENCLRLSIGTKEENNRFMEVFDAINL